MAQSPPPFSRRVFRALLKLFPAEFRIAHEKSIEQVFRDQCRDTRHEAGRLGLARLWAATFFGTLSTAPGEHLRILLFDAAYALRRFRRDPGVAAIAVLTIALGIGANTAVFSLVHQVLLRPLPYHEPERLVHLRPLLEGEESVSGPIYLDLLRETTAFEGLLTMAGIGSTTISGPEGPERVKRLIVSPSYFELLGVEPLLGRGFKPEDQLFLPVEVLRNSPPAEFPVSPVIISHRLWQCRFAGDPEALGAPLEIGGRPFEVIGILPPDFRVLTPRLMNVDMHRDLWYLSNWDPGLFPRDVHYLHVLARLKPGVTLAQARADVETFAARQREHPELSGEIDYRMTVEPLHAQVVEGTARPLFILFGAVTLVLLIACSNVASLMLAGGATRKGELGMRVALGASRERLVRQLLTESLLLAVLGAGLGLGLAYVGLDLLVAFRPEALQRFEAVRIDRPILLFTLAATTLSAVLFGLAPSLRYSRPNLESALCEGRRSLGGLLRQRHRGLLVAGEIALSFVLIAGTGLLLRTYAAQQQVDPGFSPERVMTTSLHLPRKNYVDFEPRLALFRELVERVSAVPGIEDAALTSDMPFDGGGGYIPLVTDQPGAEEELVWAARVTPGYFRAMGLRLRAGRLPQWSDFVEPDRTFVLVDEALAERYWPGEDAVGRRVRVSRLRFNSNDGVPNEHSWAEVLGVLGAIYDDSLVERGPEAAYLGLNYSPSLDPSLVFKASAEPAATVPAVRAALRDLDEDIATSAFTGMETLIAQSTDSLRFTMALLGFFGAIGILLAAVGLYGLLSFSVRQGTDEIGLRMALGAEPAGVLRIVLLEGMKLTALGLAAGAAVALATGPLLANQLFGVEPYDPATLLAVASILTLVAGIACGVPAIRALKVDPLTALRSE